MSESLVSRVVLVGLLVALAFRAVGSFGVAIDYCEESMNCGTEKHLLCKFKREKQVGSCSDIIGFMTPEERGRILAQHNIKRDLIGMDSLWYETYIGKWENGTFFNWSDSQWAWRLDPPKKGLGNAICIRQLTWDYENEKAAQIYAEQCTTERYECVADYKEDFPQYMSIFTTEGVHDGEESMDMAMDKWWSTNLTMLNATNDDDGKYFANKLNDYNYKDEQQSRFLDWANIVFWRTFQLGCGKAHFNQDGKDWTRIVCVYGPGVNYIPLVEKRAVEAPWSEDFHEGNIPSALYTHNYDLQPCFPNEPPTVSKVASCPRIICECRNNEVDEAFHDVTTDWPWVCAPDYLLAYRREIRIPPYKDYMTFANARKAKPLLALLLGTLYNL